MASQKRPASMHAVTASVHAYVQPDGGWCLNNAGLVIGTDRVVLIDTAATERRARALEEAVRKLAPAGPDYVVNTHFHGDHTFGNARFTPRATIIAHEHCAAEQSVAGLGLRGLWPDVDWGETPVTTPDVTYSGRLTIETGGQRVELLHYGPAHTTGDTVVWLPGSGVLFTGDIVWSGTTPFCLMGSITGSLDVLGRLRELDPGVVVPGHGPVGGPELLDQTESYLAWLLETAQAGLRAGRSATETARAADLGGFTALLDSERIVGNLHRAYAELAGGTPGAPIDVATAFAEMVEFNGGLPHCAA